MRHTASGMPAHPSSPRFTPGTWRAIGQRLIVTTHGAGLPVCEVFSGGVGIEQADANERLIAAAPDMFHALSVALVVVSGCNADGMFDEAERIIRAALDLAEGGAA